MQQSIRTNVRTALNPAKADTGLIVEGASKLIDDDLVRKLSAHPDLRNRVESLLFAVEDEAGELSKAHTDFHVSFDRTPCE